MRAQDVTTTFPLRQYFPTLNSEQLLKLVQFLIDYLSKYFDDVSLF